MTTEQSAVLIVNTRSRHGERSFRTAKDLLAQRGVPIKGSYPIDDPKRLPDCVAEAVAQGHKLIVVGGGDGTISSAVDALAYRDVTMGLLPLGTANDFARTLSIPQDLEGAVDVLVSGKEALIGLGTINDNYFTSGVSIGLPAAVGRAATSGIKRRFGRAGYLFVAGRQFLRYKPFDASIETGGRRHAVQALGIRVANGRYEAGMLVAKGAGVETGELSIRILTGRSKWKLAKDWAKMSLGLALGAADLEVLRVTQAIVDSTPPQDISVDGEVETRTPVRVTVAPDALRIMVPQAFRQG